MKRYFGDKNFIRLCQDFKFLVDKIKDFKGELDIRLRANYFNLYYKGNSLAKVASRLNDYEVAIHKKFSQDIFKRDVRFTINDSDKSQYSLIYAKGDLLPQLFQKKYLDQLCSNIKEVNYGEEITFEQILITDNLDRNDLIIIDRQVTETGMNGKLDLLALRQNKDNHFYFEVIEVKLGNNKELAQDVGEQVSKYVQHIKSNINDWIHCYKEVYRQMRVLKLLDKLPWEGIEIGQEVKGLVVVGGYSGIAKESMCNLSKQYPQLVVKYFVNKL